MSAVSLPEPRPGPRSARLRPHEGAAQRPVRGLRVIDLGLVALFLALTFLLGIFPLKDADYLLAPADRRPDPQDRPDSARRLLHVHPARDALDRPALDLPGRHQLAPRARRAYRPDPGEGRDHLPGRLPPAHRPPQLLADLGDGAGLAPRALVLGGRMYVRPETLSLLYLSIYLAILCRWDRFPALAWLLPLVQVAWVNSQGFSCWGPIVLGFALGGRGPPPRRVRPRAEAVVADGRAGVRGRPGWRAWSIPTGSEARSIRWSWPGR